MPQMFPLSFVILFTLVSACIFIFSIRVFWFWDWHFNRIMKTSARGDFSVLQKSTQEW